jgi:hypothetical protein
LRRDITPLLNTRGGRPVCFRPADEFNELGSSHAALEGGAGRADVRNGSN